MEISYKEPMEYIENNEEESLDILAQELVNIFHFFLFINL